MSQQLPESPEKTKQQASRRETQPASAHLFQAGHHPILQLQRTLGNRRVAQLIQARRLTPEGRILGLQPKLTVGAADDQYEQEADRVARQVISMPDYAVPASSPQTSPVDGDPNQAHTLQSKPLPLAASITPFMQRQIGAEEESEEDQDREEDKDGLLQAKFFNKSAALPLQRQTATEEEETDSIQAKSAGSLSDSFEAGDDLESRLNQSKGGGSQLPDHVRAYMEPRFGVDFSHVRVHTGSDSIQMNRDVGAQAFTHGSDIYYGAGSSPSNLELTAHELTHVLQQTAKSELNSQYERQIGYKTLQRYCLTGPVCNRPIPGDPWVYARGAEEQEANPRERRARMTPEEQTAHGHAGRARQLEIFLTDESRRDPQIDNDLLNHVYGIFIDMDISSGAYHAPCARGAPPVGSPDVGPPNVGPPDRNCIFVPGSLNRGALMFNSLDSIGRRRNESWRIETLRILIHEIQHQLYAEIAHPLGTTIYGFPITATARPELARKTEFRLSELSAIISEFPVAFRLISHRNRGTWRSPLPESDPEYSQHEFARQNLIDWFERAITNPLEGIQGILIALRCTHGLDCIRVDSLVRDRFDFTSRAWKPDEKDAFNAELRNSAWSGNLGWPL